MLKKMFHFNFTKETLWAFASGVLVIIFSSLLRLDAVKSSPAFYILLRDIFMISGIGVLYVLLRIGKKDLKKFGLSLDKWKKSIIINIVLAVLLAFAMLKDLNISEFEMSASKMFQVLYILIAGIFEAMFFYSYQRVVFEEAFGKIPSVILVSIFYSLHHIGFQPEFIKLFFVGISFVVVAAITNSALSIFPFYWGVGATLDVLVQSQVVSEIQYPALRSAIMLFLIAIIIIVFCKRNKAEAIKD